MAGCLRGREEPQILLALPVLHQHRHILLSHTGHVSDILLSHTGYVSPLSAISCTLATVDLRGVVLGPEIL